MAAHEMLSSTPQRSTMASADDPTLRPNISTLNISTAGEQDENANMLRNYFRIVNAMRSTMASADDPTLRPNISTLNISTAGEQDENANMLRNYFRIVNAMTLARILVVVLIAIVTRLTVLSIRVHIMPLYLPLIASISVITLAAGLFHEVTQLMIPHLFIQAAYVVSDSLALAIVVTLYVCNVYYDIFVVDDIHLVNLFREYGVDVDLIPESNRRNWLAIGQWFLFICINACIWVVFAFAYRYLIEKTSNARRRTSYNGASV
ncbi:hypothetical protein Tcan_10008 [Toxocara canis]|uniref:Uncharacterized protein n=1 Tax=Toxocara canis TaxID=6265 RepID=A0A0B2W1F0_TOXCA|nr:hypothetical protein Tcan_10008 [Toxocara canis]